MFCNLKYLFYFCKRFQKRVLKLICKDKENNLKYK